MDVTVEPGRMVETPTADAGGMERRAFGEFVGPEGELASYAIGWITNADPWVGRITVGIGAGNPGGATFHAVVFPHEEGHAFHLVDEPFEDVPQGGPDLSADAARAHEDIAFIWCVADHAMELDPRAWWLRHWLLGTRAIQTRQVLELAEPVLLVANDPDDELWQLVGASDGGPDGQIGHLWHNIDEDPTLIDVLDLEPGQQAVRDERGGQWRRRAFDGEK